MRLIVYLTNSPEPVIFVGTKLDWDTNEENGNLYFYDVTEDKPKFLAIVNSDKWTMVREEK